MLEKQYVISFLVIVAFIVTMYYITKKESNNKKDSIYDELGYSDIDKFTNNKNRKNKPYYPFIEKEINPPHIKKNFIDIQFHNDYRDVKTAFNNMVPSNKQVFNVANIPIKYSEPDESETYDIVEQFIDNLNLEISRVPDFRNNDSGWDEELPDQHIETGWEEQRKSLGLETSLYPKPLGKTFVKLMSVEHVQKYKSEDETKYLVKMVLEKDKADDQMLIKVSFVVFTDMLKDENYFFKNNRQIDVQVVLEDIIIEGYLSDYGQDANKQYENTRSTHADFRSLENQNMMSNKDVMKELGKHYDRVRREMEMRNSTLDQDGRDAHNSTSNLLGYDSYNVTQTIEEDMMGLNRNFS